MFTNEGYALLIGVDDYSAYDNSRQQPAGTSNLLGSRNDVKVFWRILRGLGMPASHIRVHTTPELGPADLEGASPENFGDASLAQVKVGIAWLAERLSHHGKPNGLLTYSGHGDLDAKEGLTLCPSDVSASGETLAHTLSFSAINAVLGAHSDNLTVILDTCHAGAVSSQSGKSLALRRHHADHVREKSGEQGTPAFVELRGRVLAAARRDQVAYQSMFDGQHRGAFSWAICSAVEQWAARQQGKYVRFDVSYGTLVETARQLLGTLWLSQEPELRAASGVADLAVFQHGTNPHPGQTTVVPDGARRLAQIDSGNLNWRQINLVFNDSQSTRLAVVYVFNQAMGSFSTGTEYWYVNEGAISLLGSHAIVISHTDSSGTTAPPDPSFSMEQRFTLAENVSWGSSWSSDPVSGGTLHSGPGGMYLRISKALIGSILTRVVWYQVLASGSSPANITPNGTFSVVSGSVTPPSGYVGYDISQTP